MTRDIFMGSLGYQVISIKESEVSSGSIDVKQIEENNYRIILRMLFDMPKSGRRNTIIWRKD